MHLPSDLYYTAEHLWVRQTQDGNWEAGITDYAQDLLGDIVYLDPPKVGDELAASEVCGLVESVKTGSDLHAPLDGTVTEINEALLDAPEEVNDDPYASWIFKFSPSNEADIESLLDAEDYSKEIE